MIRTALLSALALSASLPAYANDTTAELKAGGLEFTRSDSVTMEEESLFLSPTEVRVDYVFRNTSDKPVETIVAFPMPAIEGGPEMNVDAGNVEDDNFMGFSVVQDGEPIKPEIQQRVYSADIDMTGVLKDAGVPMNPMAQRTHDAILKLPKETIADWITRGLIIDSSYDDGTGMKVDYSPMWTLKTVYWWKTTFPVGQPIKVTHRYKPSVGGTVATTFLDENNEPKGERFEEYKKKYCIDDAFAKLAEKSNIAMRNNENYLYENWMSYVLTTGANWFGPISKFTLTVDKGAADSYVSFCGTGVKKIGPTTFQMTATDFYPERDIDLLFLIPSNAP
jgi:hypothetical protein